MARTTGKKPAILPNLGGSLPNDIFSDCSWSADRLGAALVSRCSQHAPNEHLPMALAREGLAIMAGLYWDLGDGGTPSLERART